MKTLAKHVLYLLTALMSFAVAPAIAQTPVQNPTATLLPSDGAPGSRFSRDIAVSGDTIVVGAPNNCVFEISGAAYVYVRDASGAWIEQAKLVGPPVAYDDYDGCRFGGSVAVSGDTIVVGARESAYVYVRDASGVWGEQAKLLASDGAEGIFFGREVAVSGDTAVVGAGGDDDNGFGSGSAYVYVRDASGVWGEQAKLLASDGAAFDRFGGSVAVSGDTIVVGARESAYAYMRDASGVWSEQAKLLPSDGADYDYFGWSVAVSGDTIVVGAQGDSVYFYVRDASGVWGEQAKLPFGFDVAIDGDTAVVYAPGATLPDRDGSGLVYVYVRDASGAWSEQVKLSGTFYDFFGSSPAISGDTVVAGNNDDSLGTGDPIAAVQVFDLAFTKDIAIDIKPGSDPNCFNINGHGVIPVAVLGSDTFDVTLIDQATLSFGGLDVRIRGKKGPLCGLDDANLDGFYDLICHFEDNSDYWEVGNDEATLTGELLDGTKIEGTDSICIVP